MKNETYTCGHCKEYKGTIELLLEHFKICENNPHYLKSWQAEDLINHVLSKVKEMMELRIKAYEANEQPEKAHAIKLMCSDISAALNPRWSSPEFNETIAPSNCT